MTSLSREEYLKKYLAPVESGDYKKRKKKKGGKVKQGRGMKIVDDDVSWKNIGPKDEEGDFPDALLTQEEKPQVEVIDNRTKSEKELDAYRKSSKWKTLKEDSDENRIVIEDSGSDFDDIPRKKQSNNSRHDSDSDIEIPRKSEAKSRKRHDSTSGDDTAPPRGSKISKRTKHNDSDSDLDIRTKKHDRAENTFRRKHDSSSLTDSRSGKHSHKGHRSRHDSDLEIRRSTSKSNRNTDRNGQNSNSNSQRSRHDSDSDLDVKRSKSSQKRDSNHRRSRHESDSDLEIPRSKTQKRNNHSPSSRKSNQKNKSGNSRHDSSSDSDLNIPRSKQSILRSNEGRKQVERNDSDSDMDLPRPRKSRNDSDSDLEIPRQKNKGASDSQKKRAQMSSGGTGGLTSRHELKKEIEERRKKDSDIDKLARDTRTNATVYREKGGKKRDLTKERKEQEEDEKEKQKRMDKYDKWGKGMKQDEMKNYALEDLLHESNKPLARYRDDADLDALQRSQVRDGDPMAAYMAKKKNKEMGDKPSLPKYRGPAPPPNRYNIQPGYRWDGVDRSSGFEKKYYMNQSERSAHKQEAYMWSVEDM
ncbi:uncharacterized protein LOC120336929 [Styela clava]